MDADSAVKSSCGGVTGGVDDATCGIARRDGPNRVFENPTRRGRAAEPIVSISQRLYQRESEPL